jgi:hypothetical protein
MYVIAGGGFIDIAWFLVVILCRRLGSSPSSGFHNCCHHKGNK